MQSIFPCLPNDSANTVSKTISTLNRNLHDIHMYIKSRLKPEPDVGYDPGFSEYSVYLVLHSML